jgi:hypothetical protein|tara:strand:+ start:1329 stop:2192 length:864 start_codon:yes stop_codon:yes gene_type:complete
MIKDEQDILIPIHKLWSTCTYIDNQAIRSEEHSCSLEKDPEGMPFLKLAHWDKKDAAQATDLMKQKFWNSSKYLREDRTYDHPLHKAAKYYWFEGVSHQTSNTCLPQLYVRSRGNPFTDDDAIVLGLLWSVVHDSLPAIPKPLYEQISMLIEGKTKSLSEELVSTLKTIIWGGADDTVCTECVRIAKSMWSRSCLAPEWAIDRNHIKTLTRHHFTAMVPHTVSEIVAPNSHIVRETMAYLEEVDGEREVVIGLSSQSVSGKGQMKTRVYSKPFSGTKLSIEFSKPSN